VHEAAAGAVQVQSGVCVPGRARGHLGHEGVRVAAEGDRDRAEAGLEVDPPSGSARGGGGERIDEAGGDRGSKTRIIRRAEPRTDHRSASWQEWAIIDDGNKATIEGYMDGFNRSDHEQILSCLTDDVE
jgi:hypothetical protein